ncbi:hypothetical protein FRC17_009357 [Serendipita sp. 399]|nr:hypothetical protein FRC17_009357 [Serendipita sp. 399]
MSHCNVDQVTQRDIHSVSDNDGALRSRSSHATLSRAGSSSQATSPTSERNASALYCRIVAKPYDWVAGPPSTLSVISNHPESTRETPPLSDSEEDFEDAEGDSMDELSPEKLGHEVKRLQKEVAQLKLNALKMGLDAAQETNDSLAKELQIMKKTAGIFKDHFQCQICLDILKQPWTLSPCGHVACLSCLYGWFTTPGPDEDPEYPVDARRQPKTCPQCRTRIRIAPSPSFVLKNMIEELQMAGLLERPVSAFNSVPSGENPWSNVFAEACACEYVSDGSEGYSHDEGGDEEEDAGHLHEGEESDVLSIDSPSETSESEGGNGIYRGGINQLMERSMDTRNSYSGSWVVPRWEPPRFELGNFQLNETTLDLPLDEIRCLISRGATIEMVHMFHMNYSTEHGITAYMGEIKIHLGWNLNRNASDPRGTLYMQSVMDEFRIHPERYATVSPSGLAPQLTRLVPSLGEPDDFDDSDPAWTTAESEDD